MFFMGAFGADSTGVFATVAGINGHDDVAPATALRLVIITMGFHRAC
jgi:hypothetical protein